MKELKEKQINELKEIALEINLLEKILSDKGLKELNKNGDI